MPLPEALAKKKAIINVRNNDEECLKWAIKSALFPPKDGKNAERPSKYSGKKDGINWSGIDFPTKVKELDRLEKQNPWLAINVFGWENERVVVYRISKKGGGARLINLMLIEDKDLERQHYCWIKRETALFFDPENNNKRFHCMMCLTHFTNKFCWKSTKNIAMG